MFSRRLPSQDFAAALAFFILRAGTGAAAALLSLRLCPCPPWAGLPLTVLVACTLLGFCTRLAAAACAAVIVAAALQTGGLGGVRTSLQAAPAIAMVLLGGGLFSLDAVLFGRRVIDVGQ